MSSVGQAIGTVVGGVLGFIFGGPAGALKGAALGYVLTAPRPEGPQSPTYGFSSMMNTRSHEIPVPIVYGKNKVGGNVIFEEITGENNENIKLQIAVGEGPIQSINNIKITKNDGDIDIIDKCRIKLGNRAQSADPINDKGQTFPYTAYFSVELTASEDMPSNPNITCIAEGRKVAVWDGYDWVTQYSQNPAYCLLDFITNKRYGLGISKDYIDLDSFIEIGEYCDQVIDGETRFQLDYVIDYQKSSLDHIQDILATFRGFLIYSTGEFRLKIDKPELPVQFFDMNNIAEKSFTHWESSKKERYNRVIVEYVDPDEDWDKVSGKYEIDEDIKENGLVDTRLPLYGVNRRSQAKRLAKFFQQKSWYCTSFCQYKVGIDSLHCEAGDVVATSHDVPKWTNKLVRILNIKEDEKDEMLLTCQEHNLNDGHFYTLGISVDIDTCWGPADNSGIALQEQDIEYTDKLWGVYASLNGEIYKFISNDALDDFSEEEKVTFAPTGSRYPSIDFNTEGHYEVAVEFTPAGQEIPEIWLMSYPYTDSDIRKISNGTVPSIIRGFNDNMYVFYTNVERTQIHYRFSGEDYENEYTIESISGENISIKNIFRYYLPFNDGTVEISQYYGHIIIVYEDVQQIKYITSDVMQIFPISQSESISDFNNIEIGVSGVDWINIIAGIVETQDNFNMELDFNIEWEETESPTVNAEESVDVSLGINIVWEEIITINKNINELTSVTLGIDNILWIEV